MEENSLYAAVQQKLHPMESRLYLSAYCILKNKEDAEDAVQETVYKALKKSGQIRDWDSFHIWVAKVLIHESYKIYHKRKRLLPSDDVEAFFSPTIDKSDIEFFSIVSDLKKAEQTVIILHFYHDLSFEEISRILKLPLSTVKSRFYRAVRKIKTEWEGS